MEHKSIITIEANREGYSFDQIRRTITVGELRQLLEDYDDDTEIMISNDNGYTYGGIYSSEIIEHWFKRDSEDDEWEEDNY